MSRIGEGLLVLLGVGEGDTQQEARYLAKKIAGLRIFSDENDKMNRSVGDIGGAVLLVSQFTLYGDARHGNRPSFTRAMAPEEANRLYCYTAELLEEAGLPVKRGVFGAHMEIGMVGNGPVTILLDTAEASK